MLITETNIDEEAHPRAFRYVVEAADEADATASGRQRFVEQHGRDVAPRAVIVVEPLP
ncbi:MAG: hypothetical protein ABSD82_09780 [Solirubrobacteraceae bacterium]